MAETKAQPARLLSELAALLTGKTVELHTVKTVEDNGCVTRVETRERIQVVEKDQEKVVPDGQ
jgi:hypothetical protein